jgi:hypothetical protein
MRNRNNLPSDGCQFGVSLFPFLFSLLSFLFSTFFFLTHMCRLSKATLFQIVTFIVVMEQPFFLVFVCNSTCTVIGAERYLLFFDHLSIFDGGMGIYIIVTILQANPLIIRHLTPQPLTLVVVAREVRVSVRGNRRRVIGAVILACCQGSANFAKALFQRLIYDWHVGAENAAERFVEREDAEWDQGPLVTVSLLDRCYNTMCDKGSVGG